MKSNRYAAKTAADAVKNGFWPRLKGHHFFRSGILKMKNSGTFLILGIWLSFPAFATQDDCPGNSCHGGEGGAGGSAIASTGPVTSVAGSIAGASASSNPVVVSAPTAEAGSIQSQGQQSSLTQSVVVASPASVESRSTVTGTVRIKNTPDIVLGAPASGPCAGFSGGAALSLPGIGLTANGAKVDEDCTVRETARIAHSIGRKDIADALLENLPIVQAALKAAKERGQ